jgi:hypothetical protein
VAFLVCSNEPVAPLLSLEGLKVFEGPGTAIGDLYALAGCDKLMGPPSTFSLWASYWGGRPGANAPKHGGPCLGGRLRDS